MTARSPAWPVTVVVDRDDRAVEHPRVAAADLAQRVVGDPYGQPLGRRAMARHRAGSPVQHTVPNPTIRSRGGLAMATTPRRAMVSTSTTRPSGGPRHRARSTASPTARGRGVRSRRCSPRLSGHDARPARPRGVRRRRRLRLDRDAGRMSLRSSPRRGIESRSWSATRSAASSSPLYVAAQPTRGVVNVDQALHLSGFQAALQQVGADAARSGERSRGDRGGVRRDERRPVARRARRRHRRSTSSSTGGRARRVGHGDRHADRRARRVDPRRRRRPISAPVPARSMFGDAGPEYAEWLRTLVPHAVVETLAEPGIGHYGHRIEPSGSSTGSKAFDSRRIEVSRRTFSSSSLRSSQCHSQFKASSPRARVSRSS